MEGKINTITKNEKFMEKKELKKEFEISEEDLVEISGGSSPRYHWYCANCKRTLVGAQQPTTCKYCGSTNISIR